MFHVIPDRVHIFGIPCLLPTNIAPQRSPVPRCPYLLHVSCLFPVAPCPRKRVWQALAPLLMVAPFSAQARLVASVTRERTR
eukprot:8817250-Alexandrium_andersonii.AAC.1